MKPSTTHFLIAGGLPTGEDRFSFFLRTGEVLHQIQGDARTRTPRVLYVPGASGLRPDKIIQTMRVIAEAGMQMTVLPLFDRMPSLESVFMNTDILFVEGGNTWTLLGILNQWNIPEILHSVLQKKPIVLGGTSAGMICWFARGVTDSYEESYQVIPGLGWIPGMLACPHWNSEPDRREVFYAFLRKHPDFQGIALEDGGFLWLTVTAQKVQIQGVWTTTPGKGLAFQYQWDEKSHTLREILLPVREPPSPENRFPQKNAQRP